MLQEELDEACHSIAHVEDINSAVNSKKSKLFDELLILCDQYLSVKVNLWAVEGMKFVVKSCYSKSANCMPSCLTDIMLLQR